MRRLSLRLTLLTLALGLCSSLFAGIYSYNEVPDPKQHGQNSYVSNPDSIISAGYAAMLNDMCFRLEAETDMELAVVIVEDIEEDLFDFSQNLFELWGIGKSNNNGVLIVLVYSDHDVRIHTGYGAEGVLPDAICSNIIQREMIPYFKNDEYGAGLCHGVLAIYSICAQPAAAEELQTDSESSASNYYDDSEDDDDWFECTIGAALMFFLILLPFLLMVLYQGKKQSAGDELEQRDGCLTWLIIGCIFMPWLIPTAIWFGVTARKVRCPQCGKRAMKKTSETVLKEASASASGLKEIKCTCAKCGHVYTTTAKISRLSSGGGGHSGGGGFSGGGRSSGGSWGGGHSGGGGASGHW